MFYRPAKQEDFDQFLADHEFMLKHIDRDVAQALEDDFIGSVQKLRDNTPLSTHDAYEVCELYLEYIHAKKDYDKGIKVYVGYRD